MSLEDAVSHEKRKKTWGRVPSSEAFAYITNTDSYMFIIPVQILITITVTKNSLYDI